MQETSITHVSQQQQTIFLASIRSAAYSEGASMIAVHTSNAPLKTRAMTQELSEHDELVHRVTQGDEAALARLFSFYHDRLWRIVNFRLDRRLQGRVDADDVMQESYLNAAQRMDKFLYDHPRSLFIWLRMIVTQTLVDVHRRHIGTQKRDASREISVNSGWSVASTSHSLSFHLLGHLTSPSQAALRAELSDQIDEALDGMSEIDRGSTRPATFRRTHQPGDCSSARHERAGSQHSLYPCHQPVAESVGTPARVFRRMMPTAESTLSASPGSYDSLTNSQNCVFLRRRYRITDRPPTARGYC